MTAPNIGTTHSNPSPTDIIQQLGLMQWEFPHGKQAGSIQPRNIETVSLSVTPNISPTNIQLLNFGKHIRQNVTKSGKLSDTISAYDNRIGVLEKQAAIEEYFLNSSSKETFQLFFQKNPLVRLGRLVLLENGNLRAVWKGENGSHIGLQFLDNLSIQYVLFKRRKPDLPVSRAYGRDTIDGLLRQITALELSEVLYV